MSFTVRNNRPVLDLGQINAISYYSVIYDEDEEAFVFAADNGLNCFVSFSRDEGALENLDEVYHLVVTTKPAIAAPQDDGIQQTVCAILAIFFHDNRRVILYQCDHRNTFEDRHETSFPYQTLRHRRFNWWYIRANRGNQYMKLNVDIDRGDGPIHVSVICRSDCPERKKLRKDFDRLRAYLSSDEEK
jgi:hypothetical protein